MLRKTCLFGLVVTIALMATPAHAGSIRLISDTWDYICKVEVKRGLNAPEQETAEPFSEVRKNWYTTADERICYRRSSNPTDCSSGFTEWRCDSHPTSGQEDFSLN